VKFPQEIHNDVIAHAVEDAPDECCGIISVRDGVAQRTYRTENTFASPLRFNINAQQLFDITREIDERGEEVGVIYHSHTRSEAYPSQTDVNLARNWPGTIWLIVGLSDPQQPEFRGFLIDDGNVEEVELQIDE